MSSEVKVSDKEAGRYITAVQKQLEDNEKVELLARGKKNNATALDVAEIIRREEDATVEDISTSTANFENDDSDEKVSVTDLEIEIKRNEE